MRELTDKQIIEIINKHRDFFLADIEENLCLEHYNCIHRQKLTEKDVEFKQSICFFCKEEKPCVKTNGYIDA